jgi:hypothetical protein
MRGASSSRKRNRPASCRAKDSAVPQYDAKQLRRAKDLLGIADGEPKPEAPRPSPMTFKEVSAQSGVPPAVVSVLAADNNIVPPPGTRGPRAGTPGAGRPPGPGKKLGERSPYRARAEELRLAKFSYRAIADQITREVREAATTPEGKKFKISQAAIYGLLNPDSSDDKKKS